jgi:hypothetical protein
VLHIVVHQNIRLSHVGVSDILEYDHLPMVLHILNLVTTNKLLEPLEKFTVWEGFQGLDSNLLSPRMEINSGLEAVKAVREFTASIASAYRLSTSKVKLDELTMIVWFR